MNGLANMRLSVEQTALALGYALIIHTSGHKRLNPNPSQDAEPVADDDSSSRLPPRRATTLAANMSKETYLTSSRLSSHDGPYSFPPAAAAEPAGRVLHQQLSTSTDSHVIRLATVPSRRISTAGGAGGSSSTAASLHTADPDTPQKARQQLFSQPLPDGSCSMLKLLLALAGFMLCTGLMLLGITALAAAAPKLPAHSMPSQGPADTLVLYLFSNSEPEYFGNLEYFVQEAIMAGVQRERAHYIIIVQTADDLETMSLPELPDHARYVFHQNSCYDWGSFGWLLRSGVIDLDKYQFFLFINSSVRGPFLPSYLRGAMHWTTPFISKLSDQVKLVGPVISCEGSPWQGDASGSWRRNPHVQSYALATDNVGLQVLLDDPHVFSCHSSRWDAIWHSELGSSAAILKAGYNLDSFMIRYQDVDWRDVGTWGCNAGISPSGEGANDGQTFDPYEAVFVKEKRALLASGHPAAALARKYQHWQEQQLLQDWDKDINGNEYAQPQTAAEFKLPSVLMALRRGSACFDIGYYLEMSPGLRAMAKGDETVVFKHWVFHGQFQDRPFRYTCEADYQAIAAPPA